jgi:hypothetical protein
MNGRMLYIVSYIHRLSKKKRKGGKERSKERENFILFTIKGQIKLDL